MNRILAITRKDTLLRFSSVAEWLFFLILPIVFTVVAGRRHRRAAATLASGWPSSTRPALRSPRT